ncbi:glycosyltransferase family 2 protein [Marinomonas shanghaiensis]|uniref:glycosyltransferase family 2 protein n=1 Tax=Marinomonas shanghaiensis TaxID=2202418 RepID=UPI000DBA817E|nr:glycosyltransferase family 2 protein [Marinomonas shanghaiensis]
MLIYSLKKIAFFSGLIMFFLFFSSFLCLIYIYIGYPALISFLSKVNRKYKRSQTILVNENLPSITIVIPAHNEETVIESKLLNHLELDYPKDKLKIIVLDDTSTDRTFDIASKVKAMNPDLVGIFQVFDGKGKTHAINTLMPTLGSDLVVFSDANVYLREDALSRIAEVFLDSGIGCVAGQLNYINEDVNGSAFSNGLYWRYEEFIKQCESDTGSMMGADGSIFAIRRILYRPLDTGILDDFSTSVGAICQGYRLAYSADICAYEKGAEKSTEEFSRKVRISNRSFNTYRHLKKEIHASFSIFNLFKMYSHKVIRWFSFLPMFVMFLSSAVWMFSSLLGCALFFLQLFGYFYLWLCYKNEKLNVLGKVGDILLYFVMTNLACFIGIYLSLRGKKITIWKKADSTR